MNINSRISRANFTGFASGAIASFTGLREAPIKVRSYINATQSGSGDPYPAGGGKNKLPNVNVNTSYFTIDSDGYYTQNNPTSATWALSYAMRLAEVTLPAGTYTCTFYAKVRATSASAYMRVFDSNNNVLGSASGVNVDKGSATFTLSEETTIGVAAKIYEGKWAFQIESGSTSSDTYSSYSNIRPISGRDSVIITVNSVDHEISLGDVFYGGYIDLDSGVLTVTHIYKQIPAQNLGISVSTITYVSGDMKSGNSLAGLCNTFKTVNSSGSYGVRFGANNSTIYFYNLMNNIPEITDLDTAKQWFTEHPVNVYYEIRTPFTVQLTTMQIRQKIGSNSIFSDAGKVEVYYVTI